ncbi:MAG TPA: hypothetical protein ENH28_02295 [Euryarchaeota archaeon]|nr:hypothetical protein [Euryarchaeota archaeon]
MQKYQYRDGEINNKAPHLVRSFTKLFKTDGVEEQLFQAIKKYSKNNPCINCTHSRADVLKTQKRGMTPWATDRVCFYNLRNTECGAPIKKEDSHIAKEIISATEENIEKLIMSYVYRLQRLKVEFQKSDLIRALILITVNEKSNKCLNCRHSKANKTKLIERLKEANRIEIYTRTCSFGLNPKVCDEYWKTFVDSSARKQIKLRNEILEGY